MGDLTAPGARAMTCVTCGSPRTGSYCAACGQRATSGRLTFRGLATTTLQRVFNLDRGLFHTFLRLTVDPAKVVRDYLAGRTVVYTHPVIYLALALTAFALVFWALSERFESLSWSGGTAGEDRLFFGGIVLFLATVSRLVFRRTGLNFVEHLVISFFLFAHVVFMAGAAQLVVLVAPGSTEAVAAAAVLASSAYFVWAYSRIFPASPARAALGAALVLVLGVALWMGVLALLPMRGA